MKRIFAKTVSLLLALGLFMAVPAVAEEAEQNEPKLDIRQYQLMRSEEGLAAFDENSQLLVPVDISKDKQTQYSIVFDERSEQVSLYENAVDNIVVVQNVKRSDESVSCYFRTIFAVEHPEGLSKGVEVKLSRNESAYTWTQLEGCATVDGVRFRLYVAEYKEVLEPGGYAPASLYQLWLPAEASSADAALFGEGLDVMVISQGIQSEGFADRSAAMAALGEISAEAHPFAKSGGWLMELLQRVFSRNN